MSQTKLNKHFGMRLVLPDDIGQARGAKNWLEQVEDILGQSFLDSHISLHALELPSSQPSQIQVILDKDRTLEKYQKAQNLFLNRSGSYLEIGTEVMLKTKEMVSLPGGGARPKSKSKGQKFICSIGMARAIAAELTRMADDLEKGGAR